MHVTDLEAIHTDYDHIYISPHLDDAALSCGGAIAAQIDHGDTVLVVTLCTAVPGKDAPRGPLAEEFHGDWNLPHDKAVTARLREDRAAMKLLGCDSYWVGFLDSIYRMPFAYDTREKLFGRPLPNDPLYADLLKLLPRIRSLQPGATIYIPMAIGYHVDHQIVYDVVRSCMPLDSHIALYEDVYYVLLPGELERRMADLEGQPSSFRIDISATLPRKIEAIDCYASQVPELFGGSEAMAESISEYAHRVAGMPDRAAERMWLLNRM